MKRIQGIVFVLFLSVITMGWRPLMICKADQKQPPPSAGLSWAPQSPRQGDVLLLRVQVQEGWVVKGGEIDSTPLTFFTLPDQPCHWFSLWGIDPDRPSGEYSMEISLSASQASDTLVKTAVVRILPCKFPEEHLTLPESKVSLSGETLKRVRKDQAAIGALWPKVTNERLWDGPFLLPVQGRQGSRFGLRRWINGKPRNFHTGMDIKSPEGTPVKASNTGRVALVGDFFFSGQSVFIDHGKGLYSMYFHLSKIRVQSEERIEKGEILGWVGQTGRSSGPHLHWGIRLGGARVDPELLITRTQDLFPEPE